nr:YaiO family outer membrane beta-barrel protein [Sphingomonas xinjiangensis]
MSIALAIAAVVLPSSADAFARNAELRQSGQDLRNSALAEARAANGRGDYNAAILRLQRLQADYPRDAEVLRVLGSSYAYARRFEEAIATLRQAQALAPEDLDIRAALARAYAWSGNKAAAEAELTAVEARDPANADAAAIRVQLATPSDVVATGAPNVAYGRPGIYANQAVARVSLDRGAHSTWWNTTVGAFGTVLPGTTVSAEVEREDRSGTVDTRLTARADQRFTASLRGYLGLAATPHADFRERWSVRGGLEFDLLGPLTLLMDARHADYGDVQVTAIDPGFRFASRGLRSSATLQMINLWDEQGNHRSGWSGRIDTEAGDGLRFFFGGATYPETEAGITRQVRSAFLGTAVPLSERLSLRATGEYERRVDTYTRKSLSLGLQLRL